MWNDARADVCDVPLTAIGDMHFVDFPIEITAGTYDVQIRLRAGATPVVLTTVDFLISQGQICWDGTAEVVISTVDTVVDTINTNVTAVLTAQKTVNSSYNPPVEQYTNLGRL